MNFLSLITCCLFVGAVVWGLPRIISLWASSVLPRDVKPLQDVHGCRNFLNYSDLVVA